MKSNPNIKSNSQMLTLIITLVGSFFMIINLKKHYFDEVWDYFFAVQIFFLNSIEFAKYLKKMKKMSNHKMSLISGSGKCIYHFMAAVAIYSNPVSSLIDNIWGGNGTAVRECWNNSHFQSAQSSAASIPE